MTSINFVFLFSSIKFFLLSRRDDKKMFVNIKYMDKYTFHTQSFTTL